LFNIFFASDSNTDDLRCVAPFRVLFGYEQDLIPIPIFIGTGSSPKEKAILTQPSLFEDPNIYPKVRNAEQRYTVDVVVMKLIKDVQRRSLSFGEGDGG
jgi:hypothetical protein